MYLPYCWANLTSTCQSHPMQLCQKLAFHSTSCWIPFIGFTSEQAKNRHDWTKSSLDKSKGLTLFAWILSTEWHQFTYQLPLFLCSHYLWGKCIISTNICYYQLCFKAWDPEQGKQKWSIPAHSLGRHKELSQLPMKPIAESVVLCPPLSYSYSPHCHFSDPDRRSLQGDPHHKKHAVESQGTVLTQHSSLNQEAKEHIHSSATEIEGPPRQGWGRFAFSGSK